MGLCFVSNSIDCNHGNNNAWASSFSNHQCTRLFVMNVYLLVIKAWCPHTSSGIVLDSGGPCSLMSGEMPVVQSDCQETPNHVCPRGASLAAEPRGLFLML